MGNDKKNWSYEQMKLERLNEQMKRNKEENYIDFEKLKREKLESQMNRPDTKPDSLIGGWIIYIFVMIAGLIFNDYITIAVFATIVFFWWRHDEIEKDNGRWPPSEYAALKKQIKEEAKIKKNSVTHDNTNSEVQKKIIDESYEINNSVVVENKEVEKSIVLEIGNTIDTKKSIENKKKKQPLSAVEKEQKNKNQRISRRKKQVKEDMDKAIGLIEKGSWSFKREDEITRDQWMCVDSDGIKIMGKNKNSSFEIKFVFPSEIITVKEVKYCKRLEDALCKHCTHLGASYVRSNLDKAISLIENGTWVFSCAKKSNVPGFTWECIDSNDIKIIGKVNEISTDIKIVFSTETIQVRNENNINRLEHALCRNILGDIFDWRQRKLERYGDPKSNIQYDRSKDRSWYSRNTVHSPCIYCGASSLMGNVCDNCRDIYSKKRKGMGGYPSSDPNARGSNGNHYMPN